MSLVSVLIPCYNAERWIGEAIESALSQTHQPVEVLVVDDGSTDGSVARIESFGARVRLERSEHAGGNAARNRLLDLAAGEWIQYLDADDYLLPDKVARQVKFAEAEGLEVVCSPVVLRDEATGQERPYLFEQPLDLSVQYIRWGPINTNGLLLRRQVLVDSGKWKVDQPCCQEHELLLRLMMAGRKIGILNEAEAVYREHGAGTVSRKDPMRTIRERMRLTDIGVDWLANEGGMELEHRRALFTARLECARSVHAQDGLLARSLAETAVRTGVKWVDPTPGLPPTYQAVRWLFGFENAERIARWRRHVGA